MAATVTVRDAQTNEIHLVILPTLHRAPERVTDIYQSWTRGNQWSVTVEEEPPTT